MARRRRWWIAPVAVTVIGSLFAIAWAAAAFGLWLELERHGNSFLGGVLDPLFELFGSESPVESDEDAPWWVVAAFAASLAGCAVCLAIAGVGAIWLTVAGLGRAHAEGHLDEGVARGRELSTRSVEAGRRLGKRGVEAGTPAAARVRDGVRAWLERRGGR